MPAAGEFLNSTGKTVKIQAINRVTLARLQAARNIPQPPTYEVTLAGGGKETHEHTADTINTPEERLLWDAYQLKLRTEQVEFNQRFFEFVVTFGIASEPPDDGWERRYQRFGLVVPDDPLERKLFWVENEILVTADDAARLFQAVLQLGETDKEAAEQIAAGFRAGAQRDADTEAEEGEE